MAVVFGIGPNGQAGPVIVPDPPQPPSEYDGFFLTGDGVRVQLNMQTSNKALADQYVVDVSRTMGWAIQERPAVQASLFSDIAAMWGVALLAAFVVPMVLFMGALLFKAAGYINYDQQDYVMDHIAKVGIWTVPIVGIALTIIVCISYLSRKSNG